MPYFIYPFISWWTFELFLLWLLWITLTRMFMWKFLCGHIYSILLHKYLGVLMLNHIVCLCLTFSGPVKLFSKAAVPSYNPKLSEGFNFLTSSPTHPHQHFLLSALLILAILVEVKSYFVVFLSTFPWRLTMLNKFICNLHIFLNVHWSLLPNF